MRAAAIQLLIELVAFLPLLCQALRPASNGLASPQQVTSNLISQLAVVAIKSRLKSQTSVDCDVSFNPMDILQGQVGPVTVSGKGWQSYRGLTCRAIQANVEQCTLDAPKILSTRKLLLTAPARGKAFVSLNAVDFGNFLTHPLLQSPTPQGTTAVQFLKDDTMVDPRSNSVTFYAIFKSSKWQCQLRRAPDASRALVGVALASGETLASSQQATAMALSDSLEQYFNELVFELDGTFLSLRDMKVTDKGEAPSVLLSLNIRVEKFPSPGVDF